VAEFFDFLIHARLVDVLAEGNDYLGEAPVLGEGSCVLWRRSLTAKEICRNPNARQRPCVQTRYNLEKYLF
jgi:hypothetical protein